MNQLTFEENKKFNKEVLKQLEYYRSEEFAKRLILETKNCVYWAKDEFKSKNKNDIIEHNGIKKGEEIIVEANSSYAYSPFRAFIFEPNNKYFFIIHTSVVCSVKGYWGGNNRLEVENRNIYRIFPDKSFQCFTKDQFTSFITKGSTNEPIYPRKSMSRWSVKYCCDDVETGRIQDPASTKSYRKKFSTKTVENLKNFFKANGVSEKDLEGINENVWDFNNFLSKANTVASNKTAETKRSLIENVFQPIINSMCKWSNKTFITSKKYNEYFDEHPTEYKYSYWGSKDYSPIVIRHNEWLVFGIKDSSFVFYNVNNKKKYMCNMGRSSIIDNIGVFDIQRIEQNCFIKIYFACFYF